VNQLMITFFLLCLGIAQAEPQSISVSDADVAPGTWVVTLAGPLCTTSEAVESFYGMSIDEHLKGLPKGCVRLPAGSEVKVIKQQGEGLTHVCVVPRGQADTDCRWGRSTGLETKATWAHDSRNPASDTAINEERREQESCAKVVAILDHEPGAQRVEPFHQLSPVYSHHFDPAGVPNITVGCDPRAGPTDMVVSIDKSILSPQFLSFWGKLAHDVTGVDATAATEAARECVTDAKWHDSWQGKRSDTPTLHVDCRVGRGISLGVYKPAPSGASAN
jgi:hypothetical protein